MKHRPLVTCSLKNKYRLFTSLLAKMKVFAQLGESAFDILFPKGTDI